MKHDEEAIKKILYGSIKPQSVKEMRPVWKCFGPINDYVRMAREDAIRWAMNRFSGQNREDVLRCRSIEDILCEYERQMEELPGVRDYCRNVDHAFGKSVMENRGDKGWDHEETDRCRELLEDFLLSIEDCGPEDYAMPLDFDAPFDDEEVERILGDAVLQYECATCGDVGGEEDDGPILDTEDLIFINCDGEYDEAVMIASFRGGDKRLCDMTMRDYGCKTGKYRDDCTAEEEDLIQEVIRDLFADGHAVIPENLKHRMGEIADMVSRMGMEVRGGRLRDTGENKLWKLRY